MKRGFQGSLVSVFGLIIAAASVSSLSAAPAQTKINEPKAQRVSPEQAALPKARIRAVEADPRDPLKLYAATAEGLKLSENGGRSWRNVAVGGKNEEIFAFKANPRNPEELFVGRRDGLWKSQDGGRSWRSLPYPQSVPLSVAIAESEPQNLYLATARKGVHKSTDGGYQWREINYGLPEARSGGRIDEIHTLIVDPNESAVAYAALSRHGVYRTTDGGANWHEFNQGLPFPMERPIHPPKLAYDPDNPTRIYLAFNQPIHSRLVRSRLYTFSGEGEWLPVEADLPSNLPVLSLTVDGVRGVIQLWGPDEVWEVPLPQK